MSKVSEQTYAINLKFQRGSMTYKPDEMVVGSVEICHKDNKPFKVDVFRIILRVTGQATMQNRNNNVQAQKLLKDAQKLEILSDVIDLAYKKTITQQSVLPFRFKLFKKQQKYLQTYIGVYINISYKIEVDVKFQDQNMKQISQEYPFYIQVPSAGRQAIQQFVYPKVKNFMVVSQDKPQKTQNLKFKIRGQLDSEIIYFAEDLNGNIIVDHADTPIRSIDIQMIRNQKIIGKQKVFNQKTEIQMIQICDGDVTKNLQIPIYMILPRYYSCPSIRYKWIDLSFQVNLIIVFKDGFKVTASIPLKLIRS